MRRVWRVRWWVQALTLVVLAAMIASFFSPETLNPTWVDGMPGDEIAFLVVLCCLLAVLVYAVFRSRVELADGSVRVVNPIETHVFAADEVTEVVPGPFGVRFVLRHRPPVDAFAVQSLPFYLGDEPRWVDIARSVTGREPSAR
ncbi:MAG TPA: hypothetical protein VM677_28480 [Actinokineospora sp.]|jgi:hypothetical protein|nr:hypothetical protein [Actinokineospora sp.]